MCRSVIMLPQQMFLEQEKEDRDRGTFFCPENKVMNDIRKETVNFYELNV